MITVTEFLLLCGFSNTEILDTCVANNPDECLTQEDIFIVEEILEMAND